MRRHCDIQVLSSECVWQGRIFSVVRERLRLPSGLAQDLAIVDHRGAVAVAALDSDGKLQLVRQYRHAAGDWLIEIPAGRLELGEDPLTAAARELEEETGLCAGNWGLLKEFFPAPGFCSEQISLFLATELSLAGPTRRTPDPDEEFEVLRMTPEAVLRGELGDIRDAKTLLAAALVLDRTRA